MSPTDEQHRALRELLGSFALGHLSPDEATALQAHVDGCPSCRRELLELLSVVPQLATVDVRSLRAPETPPADLGAAIVAAVSRERVLRDRRARSLQIRRRLVTTLTAAAAGLVVLAIGLGLGRATAPGSPVTALPTAGPTGSPIPMEPVVLRSVVAGVTVNKAVLIPHGWGVEVRFVAAGLTAGRPYRAWVVSRTGVRQPAGEFLGVGQKTLTCNMQAAVLRSDAASFVVTDVSGRTVLSAILPA